MKFSNPQANDSMSACAKLLDEYKDTVARLSPVLSRRTVDSWSIKDTDAIALERFLTRYPRKLVMLDIGTFFGVSAFHFASQPKVSEVVSVDLNPPLAKISEQGLVVNDLEASRDVRPLDLARAALAHFPEQRRKVRLWEGTAGSVEVPVPPDGASLVAFVDGDHSKEWVEADLKAVFDKNPHAIAILHDCRGYPAFDVLTGVASFVEAARTKYHFRLFEQFGPGPEAPNLGIVYADVTAAEITQASADLLIEPTLSFLEVAPALWEALGQQRARADRQWAALKRRATKADRQRRRADRLKAELQEARRPRWRRMFGRCKPHVRRLRSLVRRKLVRRVKPRIRRFGKLVELVRLLGFTQSIRFVARRLCGAQIIALRVPGVRTPLLCRTFGSDRRVLRGVFWAQHYDITLRVPPQLIIDGGANVGYASIYFANKYPNAQIIAVEPDPENCALFRKNCAAYPNIELIQGALWTSSTDLVIENSAAESWAFRVVEASSPTERSFKGFTVADILARSGKQHIDLLKLDVEGSEEQLFSSNYGSWIDHVKNLMLELHGQRCRDEVFTATKDRGFSVSQSGAHVVFAK